MSILKNIIYIIILKIIKAYFDEIEECSSQYDCFNCTFLLDCQWINNTCINITEEENITSDETTTDTITETEIISDEENNITKIYRLFNTENPGILFIHLKYLKNSCYPSKIPFSVDENYIYDGISEKYCGKKNIIITNEMLLNGYKVQLENVDGKYGFKNIICHYIIISGSYRNDVDIYINNSYSKDFLFFYTSDYNNALYINYSMTLALNFPAFRHVSFLYYSNKTFDTSPFIIYVKDHKYPDTSILDILFLLLLIFFVVSIFVSIVIVRYKSNFFNNNENKYQKISAEFKKDDNENENDNRLNMSAHNRYRNEEYILENNNHKYESKSVTPSNN